MNRVPFGAVVALSLYMLFSPSDGVPTFPDVWFFNDKLIHGTLFAALAFTGRLAGVSLRVLAPALVAYAAGSEVLQALLPIDRDGDPLDFLADSTGIAIGLFAGRAVRTASPGTPGPSRSPVSGSGSPSRRP